MNGSGEGFPVTSKSQPRRLWRRAFGATLVFALAACSSGDFSIGSRRLSWGDPQPSTQPVQQGNQGNQGTLPTAAGETFGRGPVRVALLLPLSGDPALANVGRSLANASRQAISFIEASPTIAENITIVLKDTGTSPAGAAQAASAAVQEGASLILGPLKADQVTAAGAVARSSGTPLIGFSNNSAAAGPGVYLLSVLPEAELKRSLTFAVGQGRRGFAAIIPATDYGRAQEKAFRQALATIGLPPGPIYTFSSEAEARSIIDQATPQLKNGGIDALFIPDRASAPTFGALLQQTGVNLRDLTIIGSADWEGDARIAQTAGLASAIYPTVDPAGLQAIAGEYQAKFGAPPHPLSTIAYTATILANVGSLSMANPRYNQVLMTAAAGFNGRDGVFRFLGNGQSEYALAIKQVGNGTTTVIDGPKL